MNDIKCTWLIKFKTPHKNTCFTFVRISAALCMTPFHSIKVISTSILQVWVLHDPSRHLTVATFLTKRTAYNRKRAQLQKCTTRMHSNETNSLKTKTKAYKQAQFTQSLYRLRSARFALCHLERGPFANVCSFFYYI